MLNGKAPRERLASLAQKVSAFSSCTRGNVAMMFGLAAIGIFGAAGLAIDMSRQSSASTSLQSAIDGVALSLAKEVDTLTAAQLTAKAQAQFDAQTAGTPLQGLRITAVYSKTPTQSLTVNVDDRIPSMFGALFNVASLPIKGAATVPISSRPAEVVLVLDNTGSMSGRGKMTELKKAATNFVNAMQTAAATPGSSIRVSLVPFAREVNIGAANVGATWIDWSRYWGRKRDWPGCVSDRNQPNDVRSTSPTIDTDTWYPAANCGVAALMPLGTNWNALKTRISEMTPSGNTNLTIGLAWGFNMMTFGAPLSTATSEPEKFSRYLILLTDGVNTENRWSNSSVSIDARTLEACAQIKAAGIQIFAVRVIDGNENILRACASEASMYYTVNDATQLNAVFDRIGSTVKSALYLTR